MWWCSSSRRSRRSTSAGRQHPGRVLPPARLLPGVGGHPGGAVENDPLDVTAGPATADGCVAVGPTTKIPALSALTAMFLHGGLLHLPGNMLFLFVFGNNVEDRLGHVRYLLFYLACGYLATYGFALADPTSTETLVGASGAIAGVSAPTWSCSRRAGDQPGAVPVLHPGLAPRLGGARLLVRPAVALLPGRRHRRGRRRRLPGPRRRVRRRRRPDHPVRRPPRPPPSPAPHPRPPGTTSRARARGRGAGRAAGRRRQGPG